MSVMKLQAQYIIPTTNWRRPQDLFTWTMRQTDLVEDGLEKHASTSSEFTNWKNCNSKDLLCMIVKS